MKILVAGATGMIGRRLVAHRLERHDTVIALTRSAARGAAQLGEHPGLEFVEADPTAPGDWQARVDGCDAIINLAGAGVADRRWSDAYRKVMVNSRVETTARIVEAVASSSSRPAVLVNASAVGFYGERGAEPLEESAAPADDFLARLSIEWERQAHRAAEHGVRVVCLRLSVVLDAAGGALRTMLLPFRLGLGGPIGSGRQYFPWVHWRDVLGQIDLALKDDDLAGPMNVVAPQAVTSREFARALGRAVRRPAVLPMPVAALRLLLGPFGAYAAFSQRVVPGKATRHGYEFRFAGLEPALADLLR